MDLGDLVSGIIPAQVIKELNFIFFKSEVHLQILAINYLIFEMHFFVNLLALHY